MLDRERDANHLPETLLVHCVNAATYPCVPTTRRQRSIAKPNTGREWLLHIYVLRNSARGGGLESKRRQSEGVFEKWIVSDPDHPISQRPLPLYLGHAVTQNVQGEVYLQCPQSGKTIEYPGRQLRQVVVEKLAVFARLSGDGWMLSMG